MPQPLAEQLRPKHLDQFVGQDQIAGPNGIVRRLLTANQRSDFFPSLLFWGPPGCGKTTLARLIAKELKRPFFEFSAVNASVKDIEKSVASSHTKMVQLSLEESGFSSTIPVVFVDEIHRFNKTQQDSLLPHVEKGEITLLGATTENPSFSVISPLLSRCRVIVFQQLSEAELTDIATRAAEHLRRTLDEAGRDFLVHSVNGDARVLLNVLEIASQLSEQTTLNSGDLETALQKRQLGFDLKGEEYYNTISALHKSIRGSDPNAALYWLARMLEAGQDPLYLSRRLIRIASEDIGIAAPQALSLSVAAHQACVAIGMPECALALAEAVVYLATALKSNALYRAYSAAAADVHAHGNLPVPLHIRNAPTNLMKSLGYGKDYRYEHSEAGEANPDACYLPDKLTGQIYWPPA